MRASLYIALAATTLGLSGCGGPAQDSHTRQGVGSIHAVVQGASGQAKLLSVEYAAAGLSAPGDGDEGSLVIVGVFRDGRVDDSLDLETLSINVPLSALPDQTGALDTVVQGSELGVLLEGSADSETRLLSPSAVTGQLHLRYDAPPRPGITLRGDFSLTIETAETHSRVHIDGELEVPVLGR